MTQQPLSPPATESGGRRTRANSKQRKRQRWVLLWAQDCICPACGKVMNPWRKPQDMRAPTLDHLRPHSANGVNHIDNLLAKHRVCNEQRGIEPLSLNDRRMLAQVRTKLAERQMTAPEAQAEVKAKFGVLFLCPDGGLPGPVHTPADQSNGLVQDSSGEG